MNAGANHPSMFVIPSFLVLMKSLRSQWTPSVRTISLVCRLTLACLSVSAMACSSQSKTDMNTSRDSMNTGVPSAYSAHLSESEYEVLVNKGTDRPGDGGYTNMFDEGVYHCRACGTALYRSETKFHSGCGWPSFETEIPGTVKRNVDKAYGMIRTEIVCATCGGHLGHEFQGERITPANNRHCVNTSSIVFHPKDTQTFYLGGMSEDDLQFLLYKLPGVLSTHVGDVRTVSGEEARVVRIHLDPARGSLAGVLAAVRAGAPAAGTSSAPLVVGFEHTAVHGEGDASKACTATAGTALTVLETTSYTPAPADRQYVRLRAAKNAAGR